VSESADELLQAGIRDAKMALELMQELDAGWRVFAAACHAQQSDVAQAQGAKLVATIESAVDLYLTAHRRMAQFEALTRDAQ
jgi:hypothetical protein